MSALEVAELAADCRYAAAAEVLSPQGCECEKPDIGAEPKVVSADWSKEDDVEQVVE